MAEYTPPGHALSLSAGCVLDLDPADHYARFALGKALQRQGRLAEAHAQLKMAAAMDPRPEYQEALGEVRVRIAAHGPGDPDKKRES